MIYIILALFSFTSLFASPSESKYCHEHLEVQLPAEWNKEIEQIGEEGSVFEIWFKDEERVVLVAAPFEEGEMHTIDEFQTLACEFNPEGQITIYEKSDNSLLFGWKDNEGIILIKAVVTPFAFHSLAYCYTGPNPDSIDTTAWLDFLREIKLIA